MQENKKIFESPDAVHNEKGEFIVGYNGGTPDAIVFGFYRGKCYAAHGLNHSKLKERFNINTSKYGRDTFRYAGRMWPRKKIISFWKYPSKKIFKSVIDMISEETGFNIYNDEWKIDVERKIPHSYSYRSKLIPVTNYAGSVARSKEELAIQHLDTTRKHIVPYGYGSKNPKYQENSESYAFQVIINVATKQIADVLISNESNSFHGSDDITSGPMFGEKGYLYPFNWKRGYPGRIFMKPKILTFWVYPDATEMKHIVSIIEEKMNINMISTGWTIEVYKLANQGSQTYYNNYQRNSEDKELVPVEKFIGSNKPPESERLQHLDTKNKHNVPYGYGSKNPKYMEKRQWQQASVTDEGVADKYAEKEFHMLDSNYEFDKKYKSTKLLTDDTDKIVYRWNRDLFIIKNPTSLTNISGSVRGVLDKSGNLYLLNDNGALHTEIVDKLISIGEIKENEIWWRSMPKNFITIQRAHSTNDFYIGESTTILDKIENRGYNRIENNWPTIANAKKIFKKFIDAGNKKHPNFNFVNDIIDVYYEKLPKKNMKLVAETLYEHKIKNSGLNAKQQTYEGSTTQYRADDKNLPPNIIHRLSDEYGRRPTKMEEEIIDSTKQLILTLPDGCNVYYVDIKPVRNISYGDFVEGGNDEAYPNFVPKGEIWIDNAFKNDGQRVYQIIVHEAIERKLMQKNPKRDYYKETDKERDSDNYTHEGAHEEANAIEKQLRNGDITFEEAIKKYYKK
jgi:hypothetical protein